MMIWNFEGNANFQISSWNQKRYIVSLYLGTLKILSENIPQP